MATSATQDPPRPGGHHTYLKKKIYIYIYISFYLFIFDCAGSSLLRSGFLQLWQEGLLSSRSTRASRFGGFSCCTAQALKHGLSSCAAQP